MKLITMVAELDPCMMDHVTNLLKEGITRGELSISLPDNDHDLDGCWVSEDKVLRFVLSAGDEVELEIAYNKANKRH